MSNCYLPLTDIKKDRLLFEPKAKDIAEFINNSPPQTPLAISVNGTWGSGKSTMINFVEQYLNQQKCEVIRFNPWMFSNSDDMIHSLFEEIYDRIDGGYTNAKNKFLEYISKLITPASKLFAYITATSHGTPQNQASAIAETTSQAVDIVKNTFSIPLSKRKKILEKELKIVFEEKKIVVIIDELDRLFPSEMVNVFQTIKSVLDLPGLIFVVAFDNNVVWDALSREGIIRGQDYLQKIFDRNFYINDKYQIRTLFDAFIQRKINLEDPAFYFLDSAIEAIIFNSQEMFVNVEDRNELETVYGKKLKELQLQINNCYFQLFDSLAAEFQNPRLFIKLSDFIMERWKTFFDKVFKKENATNINVQIAFVIFISYFKFPNCIDFRLKKGMPTSNDSPPLINTMNFFFQHVLLFIVAENGERYKEDSIIDTTINVLQNFPDYSLNSL